MSEEERKEDPRVVEVAQKLGFERFMSTPMLIKDAPSGSKYKKFVVDFENAHIGFAYALDAQNKQFKAEGIPELDEFLREREIAILGQGQAKAKKPPLEEVDMSSAVKGLGKFDNTKKPPQSPSPDVCFKKPPDAGKQRPTDWMSHIQGVPAGVPAVVDMIGIVSPKVTVDQVIKVFAQFQEIKGRVLQDADYHFIGKDGRAASKVDYESGNASAHIRRSGWAKIAMVFNLDIEVLGKEKHIGSTTIGVSREYYVWTYRVKASASNGRYNIAEGSASSRDPFFSKKKGIEVDPEESNIMMKAQTVATNRAISGLVGGGELSAEEIEGKE